MISSSTKDFRETEKIEIVKGNVKREKQNKMKTDKMKKNYK